MKELRVYRGSVERKKEDGARSKVRAGHLGRQVS